MTSIAKKPAEITSLNLTEASQGLRKLNVTITWAFNPYGGKPMDVDFSCFVLGRDGKTREDEDFVFYNNQQGAALAVKHLGGQAALDDDGAPATLSTETIMVDLDSLSFDVWEVMFVLSVYNGVQNDQTFDVLREAVFTIDNADTKENIARMSFSGHTLGEATAVKVAEIKREGVAWHYAALIEPVKEGLAEIAKGYGLLISSTT